MSLSQQLQQVKAGFIAQVPEEVQTIMQQAGEQLAASGLAEKAVAQGEALPTFSLKNQHGELRNSDDLLAQGPLVITFYRGGWCPYCNLELKAYQQRLADIKAAGVQLVAITPELPDSSLSTAEKNELGFDILTDTQSDYARQLGLVFTLPEALKPVYANFGIDLEEYNGNGQFDLPLAATLVVSTEGNIVSAFVDSDYTQRQEPEQVLEVLKSL